MKTIGLCLFVLFAVAAAFAVGCNAVATPPPGDLGTTNRRLAGVPQDGFPSWAERVVLLWADRARGDPQADLAACSGCAEKACYQPTAPLWYSHPNNRSARFHSANLSKSGSSLQHDSPCTLVSDIGTQYDPGPCDGSPSCACVGGVKGCNPTCTSWSARVAMFGGGAMGENAAMSGMGGPVDVFYLWLYEGDSDPSCGWRYTNGHRANILTGPSGLGVGNFESFWTQDFGGPEAEHGKIVVGAHYPESGTVAFRAHWYDAGGTAPKQAMVNVDGTCRAMAKERGVTADNATYLLDNQPIGGCAHYYFVFEDSAGAVHTYPEDGSYGIDCSGDWEQTRPAAGPGCNCARQCAGKQCGPDGCGGSCGDCGGGTCNPQGQCVAAPDAGHPDGGPVDTGPADAGSPDAGHPDTGVTDSGHADAGPRDAGDADAGTPALDGGGGPDAGKSGDTGVSPDDAGKDGAGNTDGGGAAPGQEALTGCSCSTVTV